MSALIIVDVQNDFITGSLAVPDAEAILAPIRSLLSKSWESIIVTKDWHPKGHISFASSHEGKKPMDSHLLQGTEEVLWPDHCVQDSHGAELHSELAAVLRNEKIKPLVHVVLKGTQLSKDAYSGFETTTPPIRPCSQSGSLLTAHLHSLNITRVYIVGLATDYCVKHTSLHAVRDGFETVVIREGCRGVSEDTTSKTWDEMSAAGARTIDSL